MRKWMLFILSFGLALLGSSLFQPSDIADLEPVQALRISAENGMLLVEADTGHFGEGETLSDAFVDLKNKADRDIFLDTVEFLVLTEDTRDMTSQLLPYLRPACRVCREEGMGDLQEICQYLKIHAPGVTLMDLSQPGMPIPVLSTKEAFVFVS